MLKNTDPLINTNPTRFCTQNDAAVNILLTSNIYASTSVQTDANNISHTSVLSKSADLLEHGSFSIGIT